MAWYHWVFCSVFCAIVCGSFIAISCPRRATKPRLLQEVDEAVLLRHTRIVVPVDVWVEYHRQHPKTCWNSDGSITIDGVNVRRSHQ